MTILVRAGKGGIWLFGDEYLEGKLRQRTRRYHQQMLVLDQFGNLAEQSQVEVVRASDVERQGGAGRRKPVGCVLQEIGTFDGSIAVPGGVIQATTERCHFARERRRAELAAHPPHVGLGHNPDEGFLGSCPCLRRIEKQHERLVGVQLTFWASSTERGSGLASAA